MCFFHGVKGTFCMRSFSWGPNLNPGCHFRRMNNHKRVMLLDAWFCGQALGTKGWGFQIATTVTRQMSTQLSGGIPGTHQIHNAPDTHEISFKMLSIKMHQLPGLKGRGSRVLTLATDCRRPACWGGMLRGQFQRQLALASLALSIQKTPLVPSTRDTRLRPKTWTGKKSTPGEESKIFGSSDCGDLPFLAHLAWESAGRI